MPYVTIAELRALPNLTDPPFTDAELTAATEWFEARCENYCGVAFIPRTATATLDGTGTNTLQLPHRLVRDVTSIIIGGEVQNPDWVVYGSGKVVRDTGVFAAGNRNVVVTYEHGLSAPPADLKRAALDAIRDRLLRENSGDPVRRTYAISTGGTVIRESQPGADRPFGIPEVDAVVNDMRRIYGGDRGSSSWVGSVVVG